MKYLSSLFVLLMLVTVDGVWQGRVDSYTNNLSYTLTLMLQQTGSQIDGTYYDSLGNAGKVSGSCDFPDGTLSVLPNGPDFDMIVAPNGNSLSLNSEDNNTVGYLEKTSR